MLRAFLVVNLGHLLDRERNDLFGAGQRGRIEIQSDKDIIYHLNANLASLLFVVGVNQNSVSLALKQVLELRLLVGNHMLLNY